MNVKVIGFCAAIVMVCTLLFLGITSHPPAIFDHKPGESLAGWFYFVFAVAFILLALAMFVLWLGYQLGSRIFKRLSTPPVDLISDKAKPSFTTKLLEHAGFMGLFAALGFGVRALLRRVL